MLCVVFSTSCSNEDANFDEPTETLTYDDVRQKFLDAGFKLNVPRDSSATVIELHSPQDALDSLYEYMLNKRLENRVSREGIGAVIYFETKALSNGKTECSFRYNGLSVEFKMTSDCKIENNRIHLDYFDKDYKFKTGGLDNSYKYPILSAKFVKPITFVVGGEDFTREDEVNFRFELILNQGFAIVR